MSCKTKRKYSKYHLAVVSFDLIQVIWPAAYQAPKGGKGGRDNPTRHAGVVVGNVGTVTVNIARSRRKMVQMIVAERLNATMTKNERQIRNSKRN